MAQFSFSSFNKERLFNFDTSIINELHPQTEAQRKEHDDRYTNLESLYKENGPDKEYQIRGLYINTKSEVVDEAPVAALSTIYVNLPPHQLIEVKSMMGDKNAVRAINNGYAGFVIRTYEKKLGKQVKLCYAAKWIDVDPDDFEDEEEVDPDLV